MTRHVFKTKILTVFCWITIPILLNGQIRIIKSELNKEFTINLNVDYKYILEIPENISNNEKLPLIVFLHGSGERGDSLELVKVHGPWKFLENNIQYRFAVLAPQCKKGEFWDARKLSILLDEIILSYPIDTNRIYLTGLSMGAYGTWDLAMFEPSRFAALAPVCGTTYQQKLTAQKVKDLPIWVFHGAMDESVPLQNSAAMVKKLKELDVDVQFTIYPFTAHDAWNEAYANEELYKWFLRYKKL